MEGVVNPQPHPLSDTLELTNERISHLSSSEIRASIVTEYGGIVTFYDQLLRGQFVHNFSYSLFFYVRLLRERYPSIGVFSNTRAPVLSRIH